MKNRHKQNGAAYRPPAPQDTQQIGSSRQGGGKFVKDVLWTFSASIVVSLSGIIINVLLAITSTLLLLASLAYYLKKQKDKAALGIGVKKEDQDQ